jgi:hypothetical protein
VTVVLVPGVELVGALAGQDELDALAGELGEQVIGDRRVDEHRVEGFDAPACVRKGRQQVFGGIEPFVVLGPELLCDRPGGNDVVASLLPDGEGRDAAVVLGSVVLVRRRSTVSGVHA